MWRYFVICCAFSVYIVATGTNYGPKYPPTEGEVWPEAQQETKKDIYFTFHPAQFQAKITKQNCTVLHNAVLRYLSVLKNFYGIVKRHRRRAMGPRRRRILAPTARDDDNYQGTIRELSVELTQPCEEYPYFEMDESYNLTVLARTKLTSASLWGAMRGLETFVQLFYLSHDNTDLRINTTHIVDYPSYAHRGLLLDTSRHFISVENILKTLEAMAINKMNVFHWHIVDDPSFPYQSEKFPELSERGAFNPSMVYTKLDIQNIINFARDRGIRVLPEFDVPGHTRSWGAAYPNLLTECYDKDMQVVGLGPMNPLKNVTYKLLREFFQEVQEWFPDNYIHVGGDEVDLQCWDSNPEIKAYMKEHNMTDVNDIHTLFMNNTIPLLAAQSKPVVWQEVFDEKVPLSKNDTLVHVWKNLWVTEMIDVLTAGHRVLFSSAWYLDNLNNKFMNFYNADPRSMVNAIVKDPSLVQNIVGGEACMWGEMVDGNNLLSRVWPRASAIAEVLWSSQLEERSSYDEILNSVPQEVYNRIEEHTCRMMRRGIPAEPANGPGFCVV